MSSSVRKAPVTRPPTKVSAIGCIISAPFPGKKAIGTIPRIVVRVVIRIGLRRVLATVRQAVLTLVFLLTSWLIESTMTIPLLTTTPIRAMIPTIEKSESA